MSFKEKILTKSNSYNYYKEQNKLLLQEIDSLKKEIKSLELKKRGNLREEYLENYGNASSFCNWTYINYFFRDDFEDKLKEVTKNLDKQSKNYFKWILLRTLSANLVTRDTMYFDHELSDQNKFKEFQINNITEKEIDGFKFTGDYNLHAFIDSNLNKEDKEFIKNKDIIDAGAFTGDTALPLSKLTNGQVYAFEPFDESFELLKKNIVDNEIKNITPIKKSLGNINGERILYLSGDNIQGITSDANARDYDTKIKVKEITIDRFVEENYINVGFITIDVEGAERDLLNGAINTIKTQKPILNISIYHSVNDFFEIIPWIANLDLDYEFKVYKEQPWPFLADTVVQCKVKNGE